MEAYLWHIAGAIPAIALAIGHGADGLVEPLSYDASTINDRGVPLGLDLPISTATSDRYVPMSKGDKEYAAFY